jgi:hypothetical protein
MIRPTPARTPHPAARCPSRDGRRSGSLGFVARCAPYPFVAHDDLDAVRRAGAACEGAAIAATVRWLARCLGQREHHVDAAWA